MNMSKNDLATLHRSTKTRAAGRAANDESSDDVLAVGLFLASGSKMTAEERSRARAVEVHIIDRALETRRLSAYEEGAFSRWRRWLSANPRGSLSMAQRAWLDRRARELDIRAPAPPAPRPLLDFGPLPMRPPTR